MRSAITALAVLALGGVACADGTSDTSPLPAASASPAFDSTGWLAYATTEWVAVRRADGTRKKVADLAEDRVSHSLVWSPDGRRLAWIELGADRRRRVVIADLATGWLWRSDHADDQPTLIHGFGDGFAAITDRNTLVRYRPGKPVDVTTVGTTLPRYEESRLPAVALGVAEDRLLVSVSGPDAAAYGGPSDVYSVAADGTATKVFGGAEEENLAIVQATMDAAGERIAYVTGTTAGTCAGARFRIVVRDTRTWVEERVPDLPPARRADDVTLPASVTFRPDGVVVAVLDNVPADCRDAAPEPALFAADGDRWVALGQNTRRVTYDAEGNLVALRGAPNVRDRVVEYFHPGDLVRVQGSTAADVVLAREVVNFAMAP